MTQTCGSTPAIVTDFVNTHSILLLKFKMTQTCGFTPAVLTHFGNPRSNLMVIKTTSAIPLIKYKNFYVMSGILHFQKL